MRYEAGTEARLADVSCVTIGFFAGVSGSYILEHGFHISVAALPAFLAGAAITAWLNWGKLDRARYTRINENVPQMRSRWDYRPRQAIQPHAPLVSEAAESVNDLSPNGPATTVEDDAWFDFISVELSTKDVPMNPRLPKI